MLLSVRGMMLFYLEIDVYRIKGVNISHALLVSEKCLPFIWEIQSLFY